MRPSNKSRNRNKNNNRRGSASNNINRVFESAGPEGRVRGTPQQIIDKYLSLTYDAQLAGDRVAAENFQQHAEHYSRLLIEAQKEIAEKQIEQNTNVVVEKVNSQALEPPTVVIAESDLVDPQQEKVVKFGKNLDAKVIDPDSVKSKAKINTQRNSRKIPKKQVSVDTSTLEV